MSSELKEILEKFIEHCNELENDDDPSGDGYTREFQVLRETQIEEKRENKFPAEVGKKECNIKKNRYKDILPFDYTRVKLDGNEEDGTDYINASYIKDVNGDNGYIACQGPLPHTVQAYWQMLWEKKIEIVFMTCKLEEGIPPKKKCQKYWAEAGEVEEIGDFTIRLEDEQTLGEDFVKRYLVVTKGSETHHVTQFHYSGWPDHDIPEKPGVINFMMSEVRLERKKPHIPLVVHCSAGCGRTGSICAIDYAWTLFNQRKIRKDFNLCQIIKNMREQRQSMVQTPDQYKLVHLVMKDLFETWIQNYNLNNEVSSAENLYANVNADVSDYVNTEFQTEDVYVDIDGDDTMYTNVSGDGVVIVGPETGAHVQRKPSVRSNKDQVSSPPGSRSTLTSTSSVNSTHSAEAMDNVYAQSTKPTITKEIHTEHVEIVDHVQKSVPMLPDRNYNMEEIKSSGVQIINTQKKQESHAPKFYTTPAPSVTSSRSGHISPAPKPHHIKQHPQNPPPNMPHKYHPPSVSLVSDAGSQRYRTVINVVRHPPPPPQTMLKFSLGKKSLIVPNVEQTPLRSSHQFRGQDMSYPTRQKKFKEPTISRFSMKKNR